VADGNANARYIVRCGHPDYPEVDVDFSEFAKGASEPKALIGATKWKGGFRGRPLLIDSLMPEIQTRYSRNTPDQIVALLVLIRALWRFLDTWEEKTDIQINQLLDIGDVHGAAWMRQAPPPRRDPYSLAYRLLNDARARANAAFLHWEAYPHELTQPLDAPDPQQIKILYHELKRRCFAIFSRWEQADSWAAQGKSLIGIKRGGRNSPAITVQDVHATYRHIIALTGNPMPDARQIGDIMGLSFLRNLPKHWPSFATLQAGLYPTREDIQTLFHLFLIQTGWNPQTALDLNIQNEFWAVDHASGSHLKVIESNKNRSHSPQFCLSLVKPTTSPYRIVLALIARTAPLRLHLSDELCKFPAIAKKSPWLYASLRVSEKPICALGASFGQGKENIRFLRQVARQYNETILELRKNDEQVRDVTSGSRTLLVETLKASDLRDAYIGQIYLRSGHNWLIAMFAAGHKSIRTLMHYLNHRSYRTHSELKIRDFQTHLWQEIESRKVVDPAILHALCQRGEITQEQRDRWLAKKDRTYVGMGCRDFHNPPDDIEPDHRAGEGCRVQRCTLCCRGILFTDSMPLLARRLAELQWLQERIPVAAWIQSRFPEELNSLEVNLKNFPQNDVEQERLRWWSLLRTGEHTPLSFRGAHG